MTLLTPRTAVLLGVCAATDHGAGFSRAPWVMRVFIEQLRDGLPHSRTATFAATAEPGRGVTDRLVQPLVSSLVDSGHIMPVGVGEAAVWVIPAESAGSVATIWAGLPANEARIVRRAAQRAAEMVVALSNTRRAAAESSDSTISSGRTLRQAVR